MEKGEDRKAFKMPEMSWEDFCAHINEDNFVRRYGNPIIVHGDGQHDLICMAWEYYERIMQELEEYREDAGIRFWIYEFQMPSEKKQAFERVCAMCEMTADEFFAAAIRNAIKRSKADPEKFKQEQEEIESHPESGLEMRLIRCYPVYQGETEAQAYKRTIAEEESKRREMASKTAEDQ